MGDFVRKLFANCSQIVRKIPTSEATDHSYED